MTIWMVKSITDESELKRILARLKEARMTHFMRTNNGESIARYRYGVYYRCSNWYSRDWEVVDFKTLVSEGLILKVNVGNYKRSPRRYNILTAYGFKLEGES